MVYENASIISEDPGAGMDSGCLVSMVKKWSEWKHTAFLPSVVVPSPSRLAQPRHTPLPSVICPEPFPVLREVRFMYRIQNEISDQI